MGLKWLTKHRQKPKHIRDNIAFTISAAFTAVVALVWFMFGSESMLFNGNARDKAESPKVFSTFWDQLSEQVAGAKNAVPESEPVASSSFPTSEAPGTKEEQAAYTDLQREAVIRVVPTASSSASSTRPGASSTVIY